MQLVPTENRLSVRYWVVRAMLILYIVLKKKVFFLLFLRNAAPFLHLEKYSQS